MAEICHRAQKKRVKQNRLRCDVGQSDVTQIDVLPDDVLLEIFDFHANSRTPYRGKAEIEAWKSLVHVCRRWRSLVLGSPRRLNLQLCCTPKPRIMDTLDIWPALPLIIRGNMTFSPDPKDDPNIIAALGQTNRVREVALWSFEIQKLKEVFAIRVPFPELTDLQLFVDETLARFLIPPIPDSFLGGSAPRLRHFELIGIPFPGLPKLLLSATHLVELWLTNIPYSGYISPEAMAGSISALSSLQSLTLQIGSPKSRESLRPPKRSVLPSLKFFVFQGTIEYLEDLLTFIAAPQISYCHASFFRKINFDFPQLAELIASSPTLRPIEEAHVPSDDGTTTVQLRYRASVSAPFESSTNTPCKEPDLQLSFFKYEYSQLAWWDGVIDDALWLQLLLPLTPVKDLYVSKDFAPGIATALQDLVGGRITEVLPFLENIFVEGLEPSGAFQESVAQFIAARESFQPIAISVWERGSSGNMKPV